MKPANKLYYREIPGLMIPQTAIYSDIDYAINNYIDYIPGLTESLEDNLEKKYNYDVERDMEFILSLLEDIYARWLEADAKRILNCFIKFKGLPKSVSITAFISDLHSLSIEMQKAQKMHMDKNEESTISKLEISSNMADILSSVENLIDDSEYNKAQAMVIDMMIETPGNDLAALLQSLMAAQYDEARRLAGALRDKHIGMIDTLGTDLSKKILAVDDRPEILSFVSNALKMHYKVLGAPNGNIALKVMAAQKPDLFILDIDMPGMDGYELARKIRATDDHKDTPIIFLTGNSSRERVLEAINAGVNDFIIKPTSHKNLLAKSAKFLAETAPE